ncbi:excinuclease ABC subunit UvrC [Peptacetobacter sp.]|uniref:excinuclease ABC subunit UvrC n=1 Tax=Peptacetobacter sp. TaxID=2991975 RepID=UPI0026227109|nr:excinuclease ABC subunit UvrC [Peptacetobacter sp.]
MFDIQEHLKKLPEKPGVYIMKDEFGNVIYVGKAVVLKNRVRQYFQSSKNHTSKVKSMVKNIRSFEYIITDSETEALILECNLIKRYRPKYNVLLRDDKTYPYIKVTTNEDYPRILKVRKVSKDKAKYFGPYTNITAVNDTLEVIRDTYPIRQCKLDIDRAIKNKVRPCLNYHIKKCMGPCTGKVSKEEYREMIDEVIMCLSGKEEKLVDILTEKMKKCAAEFRFEEAAIYRDKIKSLEEMVKKQKIDTNTLDLNQDVIAMARAHNEACVQIFFVRNGKIVGREHFILEGVMDSSRESILGSFAKQFYMEQEYIPKEIIIEEEIEDQEVLEGILTSKKGQKVSIRVPQKGEKKNLVEMVRKNAIEYLEKFSDMNKRKYEKSIGALEELKNILELETLPIRIESFDISNIQGVDSIGSMVVYTNGKKDKKEYRRYKIKTVIGPDDYSSMAEILERRIKHGNLPDLILLDGGKGQVNAVKKVFDLYGIDIPLWGMYKDDRHRTKGLINETREIELNRTSNLYRFVAGIQEEVHNYAITYHRSLRNKKLTKSEIDNIPGIGEKRKKALLAKFKTIEGIKNATLEELEDTETMNSKAAESVYDFFREKEQGI